MGQPSATPSFDETQWSVLSAARGDSPDALEALEALALSYTPPLRAYVAALCGPNDAEDLVQEFLSRKVLRGTFLRTVRRGTGSFRTYLKLCVRRFVLDQKDPARRRPPPGSAMVDVRLDDSAAMAAMQSDLIAREPPADLAMDRAWLDQLLLRARQRLEEECHRAGKSVLHGEFVRVLEEDPEARSHREIGELTGQTEDVVKKTFWRLRERLKFLLNEEIRQTVANREEWERERSLLLGLYEGSSGNPGA